MATDLKDTVSAAAESAENVFEQLPKIYFRAKLMVMVVPTPTSL